MVEAIPSFLLLFFFLVVVFVVSENEEEASGGGGDGGGDGEAYPDASVGVVFGCGGFEGGDVGDALRVSISGCGI